MGEMIVSFLVIALNAEKTLERLKSILGENDSEVVNAQVTLDLEKI